MKNMCTGKKKQILDFSPKIDKEISSQFEIIRRVVSQRFYSTIQLLRNMTVDGIKPGTAGLL